MISRPWLFASLGLLGFALLVWFAGPLLMIGGQAPLAAPVLRLALIGAFVGQYLLQKSWAAWRARAANAQVVARLLPEAAPAESAEAEKLRARFAAALQTLRTARFGARGGFWSSLSWKFGRQYLYQLPWYAIIGAPGAGKTTALLNSGLGFPLEKGPGKLGRGSVKGYGGTRNCDWWFTDQAVLIDTAGRYTTHDSDRVGDRQAWQAFLRLLREARPRRPLNGVLLAVSAGDLLDADAAQQAQLAGALRARLDELQAALGLRLPAYVLVTKCDLMAGFVEWFSALGRPEREQVWGVTFDFALSDGGGAATAFAPEFARLAARLDAGLADRLEAERDPRRRAGLLGLPRGVRALQEPLETLLRRVFADARGGAAPTCLRGVYLTSGTQEGTPIDRMLSAFGRELGLEQRILAPNQNTGKSFFLTRLLGDVVFAEAELLGRQPAAERWRRRLIGLALLALLPAAALLGSAWFASYVQGRSEIAAVDAAVAALAAPLQAAPAHGGADPRALLPALQALQQLDLQRASALAPPAGRRGAALLDLAAGARRKLAAASHQAYERLLLGPLLAQVTQAIDVQLRSGADPNLQYEALKASVMLADPRRFDAAALKTFVLYSWDRTLEPPLSGGERAQLVEHLDALLAAGAAGADALADPVLVESVRRRLAGQTLLQRLQTRLDALLGAAPYADFNLDSVGADAEALFAGADGRHAPHPVPGRYTLEAYRKSVLTALPALARQLAAEAPWVLGSTAGEAGGAARGDSATLEAALREAYRAEYARAWSAWLDELRLRHGAAAPDQARQLAAPDGPLARLLHSVLEQTTLPAQGADAVGQPVAERFAALRRYVAADAAAAAGAATGSLARTQRALAELASGARDRADGGAAAWLQRLRSAAELDPEPVRSMFLDLAAQSHASAPVARAAPALPGARLAPAGPGAPPASRQSELARQVAAALGGRCLRAVPGRFPFDRHAESEIALADFGALFAPQGPFDEVFRRYLEPRVDRSSDPWTLRDAQAGLDAADLQPFEAAARIREVFFAQGSAQPVLRLKFRPLDMDPAIDRFVLQIDGQTVRYAHGPLVATLVTWPGAEGSARVDVWPPADGSAEGAPALAYRGTWALLRLFDHVAVNATAAPGRYLAVFNFGGRRASFEIETESGFDPFRLPQLEHFTCPVPGS